MNIEQKFKIGDKVEIKKDLYGLLNTHYQFLINDNSGIEKYFGQNAIIEYCVYDDDSENPYPYHRYIINIDDGDYWWVDECFEI
jgi:hypothetical protein